MLEEEKKKKSHKDGKLIALEHPIHTKSKNSP